MRPGLEDRETFKDAAGKKLDEPDAGATGNLPMGFYARRVLPHIINLVMRNRETNRETTRLRAAWVPKARGAVIELGIGSGLNLGFYSSEVTRIYGVDPSPELLRMARKRAARTALAVEFLTQCAEETLRLDSASIDTVVCTWTLCSIPEAARALEQARRILKPGGRMIFLEHGRAPDLRVALWQDRLTPIWRRIAGGCHLNRGIDSLIRAAGFRITELNRSYLPGPRPLTYTYEGMAQPA